MARFASTLLALCVVSSGCSMSHDPGGPRDLGRDALAAPDAGPALLQDYSHCFSNVDCASGVCAEIHAPTTTGGVIIGRMCTRPCSTSGDCLARSGYAGTCLMVAADSTPGGFYCYQGCTTDFDCPTGVCTPVTGGAVGAICFPDH